MLPTVRSRPPLCDRCQQAERPAGWEPKYTFDQGIGFTVDWYLDNQEWVNGVLDGSYRLQRIGTAA